MLKTLTAAALGVASVYVSLAKDIRILPDCSSDPLASNGVCNTTYSPAERASALVAALNTEEKLANLVSKSQGAPRIGLPAYNWWSEALHGVAYAPGVDFPDSPPFDAATSFPMPVLMASAFDDDLIERVGTVIGIEARAWGNAGYAGVDYWTPNVNTFKDPRWGRGSETPGEDALRVSRYARSMVRGLEGNSGSSSRRVVATCKHYAGNDFEDWNGHTRHDFDARISLQDLAEYYLRPFQECTRDSKAGSIMCAYNAVNGVPSCANEYLMQTILRDHWNWTESNNYITSDCEAVLDVSANHHYAKTNAEGTALCFEAGMDTSCEYESSSDIPGAWSQGLLSEETVDRALLRLFEGLVRTGFFDGEASEWASLGWKDVNTPDAQSLALQAAIDGTVLLKNDGVLPLDLTSGQNNVVALVGFWADDETKLQGGYSGRAPFLNTPAYAARQLGLTVQVATGPVLEEDGSATDTWTENAVAAAEKSDYIIYFGGLDTSSAGETKDRYEIDWPSAQLALLDRLSETGKPIIVVQMGDQLDDTLLLANPAIGAILWASWPGQDGGTAMMELITGRSSPAGRLSITQYPANYTEEIDMTEMSLRPTDSSPGRTYRWYPTPVLPFGYGLHYTSFDAHFRACSLPREQLSIQDLVADCDAEYKDTCLMPPLSVAVTNTGDHASDFVALVFIKCEAGPKPYPLKTLAAYDRLRDIQPGSTTTAKLSWTLDNIARRNQDGDLVLYPGTYTLMLDEPTQAVVNITLTGTEAVLDEWPKP